MKLGRRRALATGLLAAPAVVAGRTALARPTGDAEAFERELRAAFAEGDVLNWTGGNVRLKRPIAIDVTETCLAPGLDLNGAKLIADFNDAGRRAITIRVPASRRGVALRGMRIMNGTILAASPAQDALALECLTNQSWIYSWKLINLDIEHFHRDGLFFDGSVFEGECHAVTCSDNGRNGMTFRNNGGLGDIGIVSAIAIFGGQMRKNGHAGIETQSTVPYQEPRDLNISQTYFVENKGPGLLATSGFSMAMGCGFENNGGCGIKLANEGRLFACRASTYRSQPFLVDAFLNGGDMLLDGCRIEGYGGFEGRMKVARISGKGSVLLRASGDRSAVEASRDVVVKVI